MISSWGANDAGSAELFRLKIKNKIRASERVSERAHSHQE